MTTATSPSLPALFQERLAAVTIEPDIAARWPGYRVLLMVAHGLNQDAVVPLEPSPLTLAEEAIRAQGAVDWQEDPHIAQWMAAYRDFGAKPKRTSPSALALLRRVEAGLPRIDPITDLYNAISIRYRLPLGGEDFAAYAGAPRLVLASGAEPFDTIDQGEPIIDHPTPGEVIWRDDVGVTCRRWNWRQGVRTRILPTTQTAIFLLEALDAMPDAELHAAGSELASGLRELAPQVTLATRLL